MKLLNRMEMRFGHLAVPNLTLWLVLAQVTVFIACVAKPGLFDMLTLVPSKVMAGEVWRLITFALIPRSMSLLWIFIAVLFFYFVGTVMENQWGTFKYNLYLLVGYFMTVGASFLVPNTPTTNYYLLMSVFLAFATLYPEYVIRLMGIIPVKAKWLATAAWVMYALELGGAVWMGKWQFVIATVAALGNYLLFFGRDILRAAPGAMKKTYKTVKPQYTSEDPDGIFHKCAGCGVTDKSAPDREFRYFPTSEGTQCLCDECARAQGLIQDDV